MTISRTVLAEAVLCTISDAIVAADERGIIQAWNPGAERIFGYTSGEAIGQSLDIIIPEQLRARHWLGYRQVMATGESRYGHGDILAVPGIRKDGERAAAGRGGPDDGHGGHYAGRHDPLRRDPRPEAEARRN